MNIRNWLAELPNGITLGNLLCGVIALERTAAGKPEQAAWFILLAAFLDFFDGFAARALKVDGEMGKQLDSLADLVTFGVAPGFLWYHFIMEYGYCMPNGWCSNRYAWVVLPLGAAYRLAKFNIDKRQTTGFLGVPTPITGMAFAGVALSIYYEGAWSEIWTNFYVMMFAPFAAALLMVSEIPMIALKFKNYQLKNNLEKYLLILTAIVLLVLFTADTLPLLYLAYLIISIIANFVKKSAPKNG